MVRAVMQRGYARQAEVLAQGYYLGRPASGTRFVSPAAFEGAGAA